MFTCAPIIITFASHYRHNTMDWLWLTNRNDDDNNCNFSSRLQMTNTCAHTTVIYTIHISYFTIQTHSFYCYLFSNFVFIKSIKIKYFTYFVLSFGWRKKYSKIRYIFFDWPHVVTKSHAEQFRSIYCIFRNSGSMPAIHNDLTLFTVMPFQYTAQISKTSRILKTVLILMIYVYDCVHVWVRILSSLAQYEFLCLHRLNCKVNKKFSAK